MRTVFLLALVACDGGGKDSDLPPDTEARNGLHPTFEVEGDEVEVAQLRVAEVRFKAGDGPTGREDISTFEVAVRDAAEGASGPVLDLVAGRYEDAALLVTLAAADGVDTLWASGTTEEVQWTLIVTEPVTLIADESSFVLGGGPDVAVTYTLEIEDWLDAVDLEELAEDDTVVIAPGTEGYAAVLEAIRGTEGRFPSGIEAEDED